MKLSIFKASSFTKSGVKNIREEAERNKFLDYHSISRKSWHFYKPANCLITGTNCATEIHIPNPYFRNDSFFGVCIDTATTV